MLAALACLPASGFLIYLQISTGFSFLLSKYSIAPRMERMSIMDQHLEITKEIVIKLIEHGKIAYYAEPDNLEKQNDNYLKSLTKAFETVYQTVSDPLKLK